jgi:hypothetical protein
MSQRQCIWGFKCNQRLCMNVVLGICINPALVLVYYFNPALAHNSCRPTSSTQVKSRPVSNNLLALLVFTHGCIPSVIRPV